MVKRIALDTNTAIAFLNNNDDVTKVINKIESIFLPVTVCGELIFEAKNSGLSIYADVRLKLKKKGKPIPENDIWIAATCILMVLLFIH